jgi:peptidoglycan/xylan/chitin deacetylase (PgdA/CDA1 family)
MATSLPVLTFHSLDDRTSAISFSPRVFQRGISKLYESGYQTLSLLEAVDVLRQGGPFPDQVFVITFDDGYQTVYGEAFPVLEGYGMPATVFLTVGGRGSAKRSDSLPSLNDRSMLTWRQIREMQQSGITFGAHTLTHPDLTRMPIDQVEAEILHSKAIIEDKLSARVDCFAYPYGRYDHRSYEIAQRHFACACSDKLGLITASSSPFALERVDTYYLRSDRLFDVMLTDLFPWYIRGRSIPRRLRRAF